MKIMKGGKEITSESLNANIILNENERKNNEITREANEVVRQQFLGEADTRIATAEGLVVSAEGEADTASQAMTDVLAMIGKSTGEGIATLLDGKLLPSQLPALAINDTFPVANTTAMIGLTAQRGDVAVIVVNSVVTDSYILVADDPSVLSNWTKLGVSYVAEAGHATSATSANNANMINNHRVVTLTQSEYTLAVKEPETLYIVFG